MKDGVADRIEPSLREPDASDAPVAARCGDVAPPAGATVVVFGADGQARRPAAFGGRPVAVHGGETAWWFGTGPHAVALVPFPAAPEIGLRLAFVIDSADPRLARQRFDLFLFSEVAGQCDRLLLADLAGRIEGALRGALQQGTLDLPPCASLDEWNAFRAGLDQLLYTRFGVTVDDCVPIELDDVDFAGLLRRRAAQGQGPSPVPPADPPTLAAPAMPRARQSAPQFAPQSGPQSRQQSASQPAPQSALQSGSDDAAALRRLFLELSDATRALRALPAPAFAVRQALLQRLALAALDVNTMPSLAWTAPGRARGHGDMARLGAASAAAVRALDELWALLARMKQPGDADGAGSAGGADGAQARGKGSDEGELDRIVANLEFHLAERRDKGTDARREAEP